VSGEIAIWVDGLQAAALPLPDRGLEFGDGLFETLLLHNGDPLYLDLHLARLRRGCAALGFADSEPAVLEQLRRACADAVTRGWRWCALRVTLTRGGGPRGYAPPADAKIRIVISATSLHDVPSRMAEPAALGLASIRWPTQPALAGIKHLNRLEQVLAAREYRASGIDEAVMLDQRGDVVSVVAGNLFLVRDGQLFTPPLDACGIAGTRRELVIRRWSQALGLAVKEQAIAPAELETAQEIFYCNSLFGPRPVASFGQRNWNSHPVCTALYAAYKGELA
jgi:4-amino-4-deoxychorismate lyase